MRKKLFDYFVFGFVISIIGSFNTFLMAVICALLRKLSENYHIIDILLTGLFILILVAILILIAIFLGYYMIHGLKKDGGRFKW